MLQFTTGQLLIAADHLRDPNFYRSVVLMLEHTEEGAMGLVVNKPSGITVETALNEQMTDVKCETPVFLGGPVERSALFVLHNSPILGKQDEQILPGLYLAGSHDSFEEVVRAGTQSSGPANFRVFCGYAGWGGGQLEGELARGDWHLQPGDAPLVLEEDPYGTWEICLRRLHRANRILPHNVRNPDWN
ncbi:MAG: YqgE/AlgH family protein [Planctomycetaceae bacterium]|nr:YqgE/AlgH family protein [Planctomycetaceae bacterium]